MKRDWLLYLVIFSLALNLGTIGTLVYLRYQDRHPLVAEVPPPLPPPMHLKEMLGALSLETQQRQTLGQMLPEHRRRVMAARRDLAQKRQELFNLIKAEHPQWEAMEAKIREISGLQAGLEKEMARFMLDFKKQLKPEQHAAFAEMVQQRLNHMKDRMGRDCGPMGPPPWGRGRGKGMGLGRGPMGPEELMGPKGPPPPMPPD
jgi:Spy/CpxP family protein refolding chaperone